MTSLVLPSFTASASEHCVLGGTRRGEGVAQCCGLSLRAQALSWTLSRHYSLVEGSCV